MLRSTETCSLLDVHPAPVSSAGPDSVARSRVIAAVSLAAVCLGSFLVITDVVLPASTMLMARPSPSAQMASQAAAAALVGLATVANPVDASELSLLDGVNVQYKSGLEQAKELKQRYGGESTEEVPKLAKAQRRTDALAELQKDFLTDAPLPKDLPLKKAPADQGSKEAPSRPERAAPQEKPKPKVKINPIAPRPMVTEIPAGPNYGANRVLPQIQDTFVRPEKPVLGKPLLPPAPAKPQAAAPQPAAPAVKAKEADLVGFFGRKLEKAAPKPVEAAKPAAAPAKTRAAPAAKRAEPAKPVEAAPVKKVAKKEEAKQQPKKEAAKQQPKKEEKKGGNPLTGLLVLLGGLYGLGLYAEKEEKDATKGKSKPKAPEPNEADLP